jgi:hypothetical protein
VKYVLSKPYWKKYPQLVKALIKNKKSHAWVARYVLSQSQWIDYPELVEELIKSGKSDWELDQHVFWKPYWKEHPYFKELLQGAHIKGPVTVKNLRRALKKTPPSRLKMCFSIFKRLHRGDYWAFIRGE